MIDLTKIKHWYYLRGNTWWVKFRIKGEEFRKTLGVSAKRDCNSAFRTVLDEYELDIEKRKKIGLWEWLDTFIHLKESVSNRTFYQRLPNIQRIKKHFKSNPRLADITETQLRDFLDLVKKGERGKVLSPASMNRWVVLLNNIFRMAQMREETTGVKLNPMRLIERNPESHSTRRYTKVELKKLLESARQITKEGKGVNQKFIYYVVRLGMTTGARLGEILKAKWTDLTVNIEGGYNWLIPSANSKNNSPKTLYIDVETAKELELIKKTEYLIPMTDRHSYSIRKAWARVQELSGIFGTFHAIRHSFATLVDSQGYSRKELMDMMGWKDYRMPDIYVQPFTDKIREASQKVVNQLDGI